MFNPKLAELCRSKDRTQTSRNNSAVNINEGGATREPLGFIDVRMCSLPSFAFSLALQMEDRIEDISEMFSKITRVS